MANLVQESVWNEGIYQLETTDPVMGGPEGIDNLQAKQLANRTLYLRSMGICEWNESISYKIGSIVNEKGSLYVSLSDENLNNLITNKNKWRAFNADASLTQKGIVQLSSKTDSDDETMAATLKAVKSVMDSIKNSSRWYSKALGEVVAFDDVDIPPTNLADCRYVKLSANDSYNSGILTNQSVSGSAPLITATGIIKLTGSKLNGKTINLINTEGRYIVASNLADKLRDDAIQYINGNVGTGIDIYQGSGVSGPFYKQASSGTTINQPGALQSYWIMFDLSRTNRTDTSTHGRDISKTFYMRIL